MSGKQLVRLAVVLVVLLLLWGAAALARRRETMDTSDQFKLPKIARDQVDSVRIARAGDITVLVRQDSATWHVNGHPASSTAVSDLLAALEDTAPSAELVAERPASHAGLGVDSAGGARVQILAKGKVLADLVAGRRTRDLDGGYLRYAGKNETYAVRGRLAEILGRSSDDWRDHRIAAIAGDSVGSVEVTRGHRSYSLKRGAKGWSFGGGGPADSAAVAGLLGAFSQVEAAGFANGAQADSAKFSPPDRRVRVFRKDGTPLLTLVFDSTASGFWVRPDTVRTIYRVESWTADRLTPADTTMKVRSKK
jgi:Domain of unknown function (DUF4340)